MDFDTCQTIKPRPILQDMPFHIKQRITEYMSFSVDKLSLCKTFPDFRRFVGESKTHVSMVSISMKGPDIIEISSEEIYGWLGDMGTQEVVYTTMKGGYHKEVSCEVWSSYLERNIESFYNWTMEGGNHVTMALQNLEVLLGYPNLTIKTMQVNIYEGNNAPDEHFERVKVEFLTELKRVLMSREQKIKVKTLEVVYTGEQKDVIQFLPYFDPEVLDVFDITLGSNRSTEEVLEVDQIMALEQMRNLRGLKTNDLQNRRFPLEFWWNISITKLNIKNLTGQMLIKIFVHFLKAPTLKDCQIMTNWTDIDLKNIFFADGPWQRRGFSEWIHCRQSASTLELFVFVRRSSISFRRICKEDYELPMGMN